MQVRRSRRIPPPGWEAFESATFEAPELSAVTAAELEIGRIWRLENRGTVIGSSRWSEKTRIDDLAAQKKWGDLKHAEWGW